MQWLRWFYKFQQMLRRDPALTDKANDIFRDDNAHASKQPKLKISNLNPYLNEIERRKKQRSHLHRSKKTMHESSSKSFRIKEKSVTSLQRQLFIRGREPLSKKIPDQSPVQRLEQTRNKQRRTQSVNRHHDIQFSKTIESQASKPSTNNFFNELYTKVRNRLESKEKERQPRQLRRSQFETLDHRARSEQAGDLNMYKISYTNSTNNQISSLQNEEQKRSDEPRKKNFRRNKYEAASYEIDRKDNIDVNINLEMDRLAARQNQIFSQVRNRQFHGSIEKSTEKYFNYESYRPIRSKNDIEIYISTVPNPSLQKVSKSTNERSDCHNKLQVVSSMKGKPTPSNQLLEYDFDFKNEEELQKKKEEGSVDDEESIGEVKQEDEFEKQRKKVELQFFHKEEPQLDWSEDQCKIDDI